MIHAPNLAGHHAALVSAISVPMYEYGRVPGLKRPDGGANPGTTPAAYGLLQVERVGMPNLPAARLTRRTSWRASLRAVGKTPHDCRTALSAIAALENARLTVAGLVSTPVQHEDTEAPMPDDGAFSALIRLTYSL